MKCSPTSSAFLAALSIGAASAFAPAGRSVTLRNDLGSLGPLGPLGRTSTPLSMMGDDDEADSWQAPKSAMIGGAGVNNAGEPPFEIRGFSLGNLVVGAGIAITVLSFAEYLSSQGGDGLSISGLGFVYGIPICLAGAALKYAEIEPVPCLTSSRADAIFEEKSTEIIAKIKQDVTRHRYGDEAHLDTTVRKLGLVVPGKAYPQLRELQQDVTPEGELAFTMVWQSLDTPYKMWADEKRRKKYETFFGPDVGAEVVKIDAAERIVGIRLTTGGALTQEYLASRAPKPKEGATKASV